MDTQEKLSRSLTISDLSVIIPAYNEAATIAPLIHKLFTVMPDILEVIVVDDGSSDQTVAIVQGLTASYPRLCLVRHEQNQGKTAALNTAFAICRGEIVIVQDADLEYDPEEIPTVIEPILADKADVVYGSRFLVRKAARVLYFYHYLANKFLTFMSNLLTNLNMTDVETGYKAFRGEIIRNVIIESQGFGIEIELTAKIAKLACRVYEVPISYYGRTYQEGKKIGFKDGLAAMWYIIKFNLLRNRANSFRTIPVLDSPGEPVQDLSREILIDPPQA